MTRHTHLGSAGALALSLALFLTSGSALAAGQVGETAPPFTLQALGGGTHSLSDYAGQVVFLQIIGYG